MGLLDKTNPRATRRSVILHAILGAVVVPDFFLALGKPEFRAHWAVFLPVFAVLGAGIAALAGGQVYDGPDKPAPEDWETEDGESPTQAQ
jgi:hypothetical protein